jgi:L-aminopeptidase/D-esterase-like protein
MPGGVGTASVTGSGYTVGALAVVNALGDVLDGQGRILAGARLDDGSFADSGRLAREGGQRPPLMPPGTATTLCVVATDAPLDRTALEALATGGVHRRGPAGLPGSHALRRRRHVRRLAHRPCEAVTSPALMLALGAMAAEAVAEAIERSGGVR